MTKVCIVHQKPSDGIPVKDDWVLKTIRTIKRALRISTGNQLVVCSSHLEEARKRRLRFERSLLTSAGIGAVLGVILLLVSIFSNRSILNILQSLVLLVFLVVVMSAFSLYQYFPAFEEKRGSPAKKRR